MGFFGKKQPIDSDSGPEKVVIIAGPSFGDAMKFVLLGALVGAGAAYYALHRRLPASEANADAVMEGLSAGGAKPPSPQNLVHRLNSLSARLKTLSSQARDTVSTASETLKPAIEHAVAEGKKAARETESTLEDDVRTAEAEARRAATIAAEDA